MRTGVWCVLHASGDVVSIVFASFFKVCIYLLIYFGCDAATFLSCREQELLSSCGAQASQCGGFSLQSTISGVCGL